MGDNAVTGVFLTRLDLYELAGHNGNWYCLLEDLVYRDEDGIEYRAPAGTLTDFASVPRPLWSLFPKIGKHTRAAVLHDHLCETRPMPSPAVHALFRRALKACEVKTRIIWWLAVRIGGPRF